MWATKNRHLDSSSRRIQSRLRIGNKYFGTILERFDCIDILGATFISFYVVLYFLSILPYMSCVFSKARIVCLAR